MFANFIYFIIVLLIYSTYQPSGTTNFPPVQTLILFFALIAVFIWITRIQFHRLKKHVLQGDYFRLGHRFSSILTRQSIMAIVIFSMDIYGLNLPSFFVNLPLLSSIPTLQAVLFLGLFVLYLSIVWAFAHDTYRLLYYSGQSGKSYILSNISFSIPVLLPWLVLSGIADIINVLPFKMPKQMLATTEGQMTYFVFFLLLIAVTGPGIIQKFWRCKPLETGYYRTRIEKLCERAGMKYTNIMYWPIFGGRMITAGVMGVVKKFRYILVTGALLEFLEPEEIDAVIAHEIGHVKKYHLLYYLLFFVGYLIIPFTIFDLLIYSIFLLEPVYNLISNTGFNQSTMISSVFSLTVIIIFIVYFRFIFGYFMRNFERQADTYVYALFDSGRPLISTLEKIALTSGQPLDKPNWHHFSIKKRIDYLKKCEEDKVWITRQDRKIKKSIFVYLIGIILLCTIGYNLSYGETGKKLNLNFLEKILIRQIEKTPENPELYRTLGDLYFTGKNYDKTIQAYERSIMTGPDNPRVLNNLAWLYATCEIKKYRNPKRALQLAIKAAEIKKAPHILDTLAESYYVNKMYKDAVAAEMFAVRLANDDRGYYEKQLEKFMNASKSGPKKYR